MRNSTSKAPKTRPPLKRYEAAGKLSKLEKHVFERASEECSHHETNEFYTFYGWDGLMVDILRMDKPMIKHF